LSIARKQKNREIITKTVNQQIACVSKNVILLSIATNLHNINNPFSLFWQI